MDGWLIDTTSLFSGISDVLAAETFKEVEEVPNEGEEPVLEVAVVGEPVADEVIAEVTEETPEAGFLGEEPVVDATSPEGEVGEPISEVSIPADMDVIPV